MNDYHSFVGQLKANEIKNSRVNKGDHKYLIEEDLLAYYLARSGISNKDFIDLLVLKSNRILNSDLKLSSFKMRISNMNFDIYQKGNKNNSEQGRNLAKYLNKEYTNKRFDNSKLKEYINILFNESIV